MFAVGEPRDAEVRTRENIREAVSTVTEHTRAEALFASDLQPSDRPTSDQVARAIHTTLLVRGGVAGCAAVLAAEYGEHPETAAARMRWALEVASSGAGVAHALAA